MRTSVRRGWIHKLNPPGQPLNCVLVIHCGEVFVRPDDSFHDKSQTFHDKWPSRQNGKASRQTYLYARRQGIKAYRQQLPILGDSLPILSASLPTSLQQFGMNLEGLMATDFSESLRTWVLCFRLDLILHISDFAH